MNNLQENRMTMYVNVQKVTNFHKEVWQDHQAFVKFFSNFEDQIDRIRETAVIQEGHITGVTKDKEKVQNYVAGKAIKIAQAVYAFASFTGNNKLKDRVSYSPTMLKYSRDSVIVNMLNVILSAGKQNLSELEMYGVAQADIDELETLIDNIANTLEDPRQAITNRARATDELKKNFREVQKTLKEQLDKLMIQFKDTSYAFYKQYHNARKIIDLGIRHRKLEEETVLSE